MNKLAADDALAASLRAALAGTGGSTKVTVLEQTDFQEWSTSPAKVIRCRVEDGTEVSVFCKFDSRRGKTGYDHRQGLHYEGRLYQDVLEPLHVTTPRFLGVHSDPRSGEAWLLLEYLEDCTYSSMVDGPQLAAAARWIAEFHARAVQHIPSLTPNRITSYDREYYLGWAHRTAEFTEAVHDRFPWLPIVCDRFDELVDSLCSMDPTIIHGEYYHKNILFRGDEVYPIDWESAALGPGVIDLAALIDGFWPPETVQTCCDQYLRTRWPGGAPEKFMRNLNLARLYLHFRWLGSNPEWTIPKNLFWRIQETQSLGEQLGVL